MGNYNILIIFGILLTIYLVYCITKPADKKPEPSKTQKDLAAIELLRGGDPSQIASKEGISVEELENWKKSFLDDAVAFDETKNTYMDNVIMLKKDIQWFEKTCEKHIGSDWKKITNYDNRNN